MYETLMYLHLSTILPCVFLGAYLIGFKKRNQTSPAFGYGLHGAYFLLFFYFTIYGSPCWTPIFESFRMDTQPVSDYNDNSTCKYTSRSKGEHQASPTNDVATLF